MSLVESWHGTPGGYTNHRCRCRDCQQAWNRYRRPAEQRQRRTLIPVELPPSFPARACTDGDLWLFFPERSDPVAYQARTRLAKKLCGTCLHQSECAEWAIQHRNERGIWGGLTERERDNIRRQRKTATQ